MTTITRLMNRITSPYDKGDNSNMRKLLAGNVDELDALEQNDADLLDARNVDVATGKSLEYIGALYTIVKRTGETDDQLRTRIKVAGHNQFTSGTETEIHEGIAGLLGVDVGRVSIKEGSASFNAIVFKEDLDSAGITNQYLLDSVDAIKPIGVGSSVSFGGTFTYTDALNAPGVSIKGYNNIANSNPNGGTYSGLVEV